MNSTNANMWNAVQSPKKERRHPATHGYYGYVERSDTQYGYPQ
jgi:hypothetical protein